MIRPNVRAGFGRREAEILIALAGPAGEAKLSSEGIDALLDDVDVVRTLLRRVGVDSVPAPLVFYLLVRHAFVAREIYDRQIADYTAALLLEFGRTDRLSMPGGPEDSASVDLSLGARGTIYLTDVLQELERARGDQEFLLRAHLGNLSLWLAGVFPDHVTHRVQRRGAPPLSYYDEIGASSFRTAATMDLALRHGLGELYLDVADRFPELRAAINSLSDALFFPSAKDPVERLLREVKDSFASE